MNTFLTISKITREAARILENNLKAATAIRRDYDGNFAVAGAKIGDTLNIRKPARYVGREGQQMQIEGITETSVPLVLEKQFGVDFSFSSKDLLLSIDDFNKRVLAPAVAKVANKIDHYATGMYDQVNHFVGTPQTVPNALLTYLQAGQKLDEESAPQDEDRSLIMTPAMQVTIVDTLKGLFQQATLIGKQYASGKMGQAIGFDWMMDQNIRTHTVGALGGAGLVNGANQTGNSLITDGWSNTITNLLLKGDIIDIGSGGSPVNAVNQQSFEDVGSLQQFVVTANVSSDGSGNATIPIYPAITPGGAFQNVSRLPVDNDAIRVFGHASTHANKTTPAGLAFHRDFAALGSADLPLPGGTDKAARVSDDQLGFSIRLIRDYTIADDQWPCRIDVLVGRVAIYPELCCRIQS